MIEWASLREFTAGPKLRRAWAQAHYEVTLRGRRIRVRLLRPHPVLDSARVDSRCWILLTAFNPMARRVPSGLNRARQRALTTQIARKPLRTAPAHGRSPDRRWCEPSIWIAGLTPDDAIRLARRWRQAAIVIGGGALGAARVMAIPAPARTTPSLRD